MKSRIKVVIVLCAIILLGIALFVLLVKSPEYTSTSFANKVIIELTDEVSPFSIEVENGDAIELINIFHNKQIMHDSISCPFGGARIILLSGDDELMLNPAGDDCPTVSIGRNFGGGYISLSENENERVREILVKYGITYPFV